MASSSTMSEATTASSASTSNGGSRCSATTILTALPATDHLPSVLPILTTHPVVAVSMLQKGTRSSAQVSPFLRLPLLRHRPSRRRPLRPPPQLLRSRLLPPTQPRASPQLLLLRLRRRPRPRPLPRRCASCAI